MTFEGTIRATGRRESQGGLPEDIELDEAGRNWVQRRQAGAAARQVRQMAADAAVCGDICRAYVSG